MLVGYRTIIVNLVALFAAWLNTHYQIVIDPDAQIAIVTTIITVANILLRFLSKTPVFKKVTEDAKSDQVPKGQTDKS